MRNTFKILVSVLLVCVPMFTLTGCGKGRKDKNIFTFDDRKIDTIEIMSHGYPVNIAPASEDEITLSIAGVKGDIAVQDGSVLSVTVPEPKAGLNLSSIPTLTILLPQRQFEAISLTSTSGDVDIRNVNVINLTVNNEIGNISTYGLTGEVFASTALGKADSTYYDLSIVMDNVELSASLSGIIGGNSKRIEIYTGYGDISIM